MMTIKSLLTNLTRNECGQDLIEYALIAALIGLAMVASMKGLATAVSGVFTTIGTTMTTNT